MERITERIPVIDKPEEAAISSGPDNKNHRMADSNDMLLKTLSVILHPTSAFKCSPVRNEIAIPPDTAAIAAPFIRGSSFLGNQRIITGARVGNNPPILIPKQVLRSNNVAKFDVHKLKMGAQQVTDKIKTRVFVLILPTSKVKGIDESALESSMQPTKSPTVALLTWYSSIICGVRGETFRNTSPAEKFNNMISNPITNLYGFGFSKV
mgnify:CR=1 FL=1